jgi:hypothetical protein
VRIDVTNAAPKKNLSFDKIKDFRIGGDIHRWQKPHRSEDIVALPEIAKCHFTYNERVHQDLSAIEKLRQFSLTSAQVIDPNRCVDQNHLDAGRRRGTAFSFGSVPASLANRRALSRSISAFNASRTRVDFS